MQPILCKDSVKIRPRPDYEGFVLDYAEGEEPQEGKVSAVQRHKETVAATDAMYKAQMKAHEEKVRAQEEAKERLKAEREAREQALRNEAGQQPTKKGGGVKFSLGEDEITEESKVLDDVSEEELSTSKAKFSIVEDPEEIERLEKGPKVTRYRAMVEIDGKLYPPMSVKVDGKLREPTDPGVWERSDETPFEFTEEQKAAMAALDAKKGKGSVEIVPGKVRYIKDSETGTGTLKFRLKKDNGDDIWAAYNPYFHTSTSGMNDQFSSAWKRPNLVVVEVEVPESELSDGYQAPYAKDAVGDTPWKSGTVNNALPADRQRTVTLSRWAKVKGKVDDSEVTRMIAQQLEGLDIEVPFNVVTPSLREELVKLGVRIGPPEKGNAGKAAIPAYEEWVKSQDENGGKVNFSIQDEIKRAEEETETNPSDEQKRSGNYKKGHVRIDGFDITIENPRGSVRSGTDESGNTWSVTMNNTYGYIRGTEGVDGDHIDVFLSDHLNDWNGIVYVVDQVKEDGSFDEHKVMYGFNSKKEAKAAYLANYSPGWKGLGKITGVTMEDFKKWVDSSHRKTKAFSEYKKVMNENFDRTPIERNKVSGAIRELIKYSRKAIAKVKRLILSNVTERQLDEYRKKGIKGISSDYVHSIESSSLRHYWKRHKDDNRTQITLTEDELSNIMDIIEDFTEVKKGGKTNTGLDTIIYIKKIGEDTFGYVEEIRTGNDSLAFKTAYKKRKQVESSDELLPDGHPQTSITTPDKSNNVSTDKSTKNNSNPQENSDKITIAPDDSVSEPYVDIPEIPVEDIRYFARIEKYIQSLKVPERITSQAQAAMWTYQVLGRVRGALNKWYGDVGSKDFRMGILSTDSDQGREIDLRNALYGSARVNEYLDFVQPKLYQARDNSTSEEARRYFEELIDDCNYARQWYDRAAKGDTTVLDDAPPRFDIDPDAEGAEDYDAGRMTPPSATTRRSSRAMAPSPARCSLTGRWRRPS